MFFQQIKDVNGYVFLRCFCGASVFVSPGNNGTEYLTAADGTLEALREGVPLTDALQDDNVLRHLSPGEKLEAPCFARC